MGKYFICSDTHFSHENIIKYCNRPFANATVMNENLIALWNSVVSKDDIVYHLGDFIFGKNQHDVAADIMRRLNGEKRLVFGNHDMHNIKWYYDVGFSKVYDKRIIINDPASDKHFILSHRPVDIKFLESDCFINIYGHIHNSVTEHTFTKKQACACIDRHFYMPIRLDSISEQCNNSEIESIDFMHLDDYTKFNAK